MERYTNLVRESDHKQRIQNFCERLRPPDVEKLQFICVDTIPEGNFHKLEGLVLQKVDDMGQIEMVIEALIRIGRKDLLNKIPGDHTAASTKYSSLSNTNYDRLRIALLYIANNLTDTEDLDHLKRILKDLTKDNRRLQSVRTVLELFDLLTTEDIVNSSQPDTLLCVFRRYVEEPWFSKVQSEYVDVAKRTLPEERRRDFWFEGSADLPHGIATKFKDFDMKKSKSTTQEKQEAPGPGDEGSDTNSEDMLSTVTEGANMETEPFYNLPSESYATAVVSGFNKKKHSLKEFDKFRFNTKLTDKGSEKTREDTQSTKTGHDNKADYYGAEKRVPSILSKEDAKPCPHQKDSEGNNYDNEDNDDQLLSDQTDLYNVTTQVIDEDDGISYRNSFSQNENEETCQTSTLAAISSSSQAEYPMSGNPRGWAVIFNIETFTKVPNDPTSTELDNRHGSSKDAESLESAFERLHFDVERHNNNTLTDIIALTNGYAARDHSSRDCFVFCILTHGSEGKLFDAHGHPFQFEQIFQKFSAEKCPTLSGKPKLFFLQACQGNQPGVGRNLQADTTVMDPRLVVSYLDEGHSPNEADFLVFFPSRLGLPAFRDDNRGSWFIQSLVKHLNENAERHSLTDIFTDVINEVSSNFVTDRDTSRRYYQTPKFDSSLRKKLFFRSLRVT